MLTCTEQDTLWRILLEYSRYQLRPGPGEAGGKRLTILIAPRKQVVTTQY